MVDLVGGRYVLLEEPLRGGGFSVVRKAVSTLDGETVAIKFVSGAADDVVRKLFQREVSLLRKSKHPNIVRFVDSGTDDTGTPYLVLEWVEDTLRETFDSDATLAWQEFIQLVLRPIADAVAHLHRIDIEHRDLKPKNVLAKPDGTPLLADFGIAKLHHDAGDSSLTVAAIGTRLWAPPEYANATSFLRDVFALGLFLVEGMTPRESRATQFHELGPALDRLDLPEELRQLISTAIDIDPAKRPRNAIEFLRRLDRAVAAQQPAIPKSRLCLGLTGRARTLIVGDDGLPDKAETKLLRDLEGESWATFRWDGEQSRFDRDVVMIIGAELLLTTKRDAARGILAITNVKRPDYDALERMRERALKVDGFIGWSVSKPLNPATATPAYELLVDRVKEHHERAGDDDDSLDNVGTALISSWRHLLEARETVASESIGVIEFENAVRRSEHETVFTMLEEREIDLVGSEWQILDERQRATMRGAAVQQTGTSLSIRWQFTNGNLPPKARQLHPYLGPTQTAINRQRDALQRLQDENSVNSQLLDLLADPASAKPPHLGEDLHWTVELDESKKAAVRAAIGLVDCMVVEGPPGTGKTRFIAESIVQQIRNDPNSRILIVSQTHVAIDNALDRLIASDVNGIVRIGRTDDDRIAQSTAHLLLDHQGLTRKLAVFLPD